MAKRYKKDFLRGVLVEVLQKSGGNSQIISDVVNVVIESSLRGLDTHGIAMVPKILKRCKEGRSQLSRPAEVIFKEKDLSIAAIEGHLAPGQHSCLAATRLAKLLAAQRGVGLVTVRNSTHFGGCIPYLVEIIRDRMMGLIGSNSLRSMGVFGLSYPNLGNNPFGFAAPVSGGTDYIFDFSSAIMSFGKKAQLESDEIPVPEGAFKINERPDVKEGVSEIADSLSEIAEPFGGFKGASVAMMIEILSGVLGEGYVGEQTEIIQNGQFLGPSHFVLVINPASMPSKSFEERMKIFVDGIRRRSENVRIPGDKSLAIFQKRSMLGIPIDKDLIEEIKSLCEELDVEWQ